MEDNFTLPLSFTCEQTDLPSIADFTATVLSYTERQPVLISTPTRPDHSCHSDRAMMEEMIREELGTLAMHVSH